MHTYVIINLDIDYKPHSCVQKTVNGIKIRKVRADGYKLRTGKE